MMDNNEFNELAKKKFSHAVSIYMPTHNYGMTVNEQRDLTRFKKMLQIAASMLIENGLGSDKLESLLAPAYALAEQKEFWNSLDEGLAVFLATDFFKLKQLPVRVQEQVHVTSSFYLTPLAPLIME
jgi:uncharacterized circularly permuted ATP-grasp superfamily protein